MNINPDIYYLVCGAPAEDLLDTPVLVMPLDREFFEFIDARRTKLLELHELGAECTNFRYSSFEWASCNIFEPEDDEDESYYDSIMSGEPTDPVLGAELIALGITEVEEIEDVRVYGSWLELGIGEHYLIHQTRSDRQPFKTVVFSVCGREKHSDIHFGTTSFEYEKLKHIAYERATVAAVK